MSNNLNIEDVLEKTGGFGRFQLFALISIIYAELPSGILGLLPVFVSRVPDEWLCVDKDEDYYNSTVISSEDVCSCNGMLYGGNTTIVSEWDLVCNYAWVSDFVTSVQMAGMFIGGLFGSQISDWFGRKKTLYLSCLLMLTSAAASAFSPNPFFYAGARFVVGASMASYLVCGAIYPMEFFTPRYRSLSGTLGPWGEGVMALSLLGYYFPAWRTLSWISALPMALVFLSFPFLPESPRYLINKGKEEEVKKVFAQIARWNGREKVDDAIIEKLVYEATLNREIQERASGKNQGQGGGMQALQIFLDGKHRTKILIFMALWFSCSVIYYGISFGMKNLSGNLYLNVVFLGLIDATAFPSAVFIIDWLGRKKASVGYLILACIPLMGIVFMELNIGVPKSALVVTILSLVGKFFIAGAWSSLKCFTGESFPTSMRSTAVGVTTVSAAFGGVLAPQVIFLSTIYKPIPYFIFGGLACGSAWLSFLLKETSGLIIQENQTEDDDEKEDDKI